MTDHYITLGLGFALPHVYQQPSFGHPFGLGQNNFQLDFDVSYYRRELGAHREDNFAGGPTLALRFAYMGSGLESDGSRRFIPSVSAGWLQRLSLFYVNPSVGVGIGINSLNFGRGSPPPDETSVNVRFGLELGLSLCQARAACPAIFASYQYDFSIYGNPNHAVEGLAFGLRALIDIEPVVALPHPEGNQDAILYRSSPAAPERIYVPIDRPCPAAPPPPAAPVLSALEEAGAHALESPIFFNRRQAGLSLISEWVNQRNARGRMRRVQHRFHSQLDTIVQYLQNHPNVNIRIQAYAHELARDAENRRLAYGRIQAVRAYLAQHGIAEVRLLSDTSLVMERRRGLQVILDVAGQDVHGNRDLLNSAQVDHPLNRSVRITVQRRQNP